MELLDFDFVFEVELEYGAELLVERDNEDKLGLKTLR